MKKLVRIYPPVNDEFPEMKKGGNWLKGAVNPAHKGYCTPMTKPTCTGHRRAFALMMKKKHGFHKKQEGGDTVLQNMDLNKFGQDRLNYFKNFVSNQAVNKIAEDEYVNAAMQYAPQTFAFGGTNDDLSAFGYDESQNNIDDYIAQMENINNQNTSASEDFFGGLVGLGAMPQEMKMKTKMNPLYKDWYNEYNNAYGQGVNDFYGTGDAPTFQTGGANSWMSAAQKAAYAKYLATLKQAYTQPVSAGIKPTILSPSTLKKAVTVLDSKQLPSLYADYFGTEGVSSTGEVPAAQTRTQASTVKPATVTKTTPVTKATTTVKPATTSTTATKTTAKTATTTMDNTLTDDDVLGTTTAATKAETALAGTSGIKPGAGVTTNATATPTGGVDVNEATGISPYILYPKVNRFGKTGQAPLYLDPTKDLSTSFNFRRRILPGKNHPHGQLKNIVISHGLPTGVSSITNEDIVANPVEHKGLFSKKSKVNINDNSLVEPEQRHYQYGGISNTYDMDNYDLNNFDNSPFNYHMSKLSSDQRQKMQNMMRRFAPQVPQRQEGGDTPKPFRGQWDPNEFARTKLKYGRNMGQFAKHMIGPSIDFAAMIGRSRTEPNNAQNIENLTSADNVFTTNQEYDRGYNPFNSVGNDFITNNVPVQFTGKAAYGGQSQKFDKHNLPIFQYQQGGTYELSEKEIANIMAHGGQVEFID